MHPTARGDRGLVVLTSVARPAGHEHRSGLAGAAGEDLRSIELETAVHLGEGALTAAQLGADQVADRVDAREDRLVALGLRLDALRAPHEHVVHPAGVLVRDAQECRALPHVAEGVEGAPGVGEGELSLVGPGEQVLGAVEQGGSGEVLALGTQEHPEGTGRVVAVPPDLGVAEVRGVALGLVGDDRVARVLGEGHQVRGGDEALGGLTLTGDLVLDVTGVAQHVRAGDRWVSGQLAGLEHQTAAGVGAVAVVAGARDDRGLVVRPGGQVRGGGVAPVDELARVQWAELVEGVVGVPVHEEPVGIIEPPHGWNHVVEGQVGIRLGT